MGKTFSILFFVILSISYTQANSLESIVFKDAEVLDKYTTRLPFKLIDHLLVVEAELYGEKGNFIIDTGSKELILNIVHFKYKYNKHYSSKQSFGVSGEVSVAYKKLINEFRVNSFSIKNIRTDILDLSHIEKSKKMNLLGIIGYEILKDYEVFIDLYLNQITLTKVDKKGKKLSKNVYLEKVVDSIKFKLVNHTIVLKASVKDERVKLGLDSGAEFNQINKNVNKKILKNFFPKKRLVLRGANKKKLEVMLGKLYRVNLSKTLYLGPMHTVLTNLETMNEAYGTNLDGILGYEFLRQKRTIINYKKEMLYFINFPNYKH